MMKNKLLITADVIVTVCSVMYFSWREEDRYCYRRTRKC